MGIKERRSNEKVLMKKRIQEAAVKIIEQEGYASLSIRKIAASIEYSPTTIYLYYKDKAEIIQDMADEVYNGILHRIEQILNAKHSCSIELQVDELMRTFIVALCQEPEIVKAIMYSGVNVIFANNSAGKPTNTGIKLFDKLLDGGIEKQIFKRTVKDTSWIIVSSLLGFVMCSIANQLHLQEDFEQQVTTFIGMLMNGICTK